jgi:hypothetical protein
MKKYTTKQSSIKGAGKGLFTNASFKKGEVIGLAHVNGQPTKVIGKNHNHNEKTPTANNIKNGNKRYLIASRNLKPGEEITTNYRLQPELEQPEDFQKKKGGNMTPQKDGYRTYSPFKNLPYIDVESDTIDSNNIVYDLNLQADNGLSKFIEKNTGSHTLPGAKVIREIPVKRKGGRTRGLIPMPKPSKKGLASKKYSRSLEATNRLFTENKLFEKPKSRKNKVFDPRAKYYQEGGHNKSSGLHIEPKIYPFSEDHGAQGIAGDLEVAHKSGIHGSLSAELPFFNKEIVPRSRQTIGLNKKYKNIYGDITGYNESEPGKLINPSLSTEIGYNRNLGNKFNFNVGLKNTMHPGSYFNPSLSAGIKYGFQDGGDTEDYIELELDDNEIAQYVKGGYVVEDISVPSLTKAQQGLGEVPAKQELIQAPRATINVDPNLDRDASRGEKIANYIPTSASYKNENRPKSNFVPSEDASPEFINKLKSSGYYPVKSESGDYEVFSNKDISDLIYRRGMSPGELSEKLKLGDSKEIEKQFKPVYANAAGIHAKRNKEKIDGLIKSGMTKDQAVASLVKQGEGDVQGLNSIYGEYTEDAYQRQKAEAEKLITPKKTDDIKEPALKEKFSKFFAEQDEARNAEIEAMKNKIDYSGSLTPSETNINTANKSLGNFGRIGKDAYSANESLKAEVDTAYDNKTEEQKTRPVINALLNSDLTEEQKKEYLNDPEAFQELYNQHAQWNASPAQKQGVFMTASGIPSHDFSFRSDFKINPKTTTTIDIPGGIDPNARDMDGKLIYPWAHKEKSTVTYQNPLSTWTKARDLKKNAPSGRVDMLDKEWIMGVLGFQALPAASSIVSAGLKAAPAALPWLNAGNALAAQGVYNTATEYLPNTYDAIKEANTNEKGWTDELISKAAYNGTKSLLSGVVPLSSTLKNYNAIKQAKTAFGVLDNGLPVATGSTDPLKHIKFLNAMHSLSTMAKKSGGSTNKYVESELSQKEIDDLIAQGYIIEELD